MGENKNEGLELLRKIRHLTKLIVDIKREIDRIYSDITNPTVKTKEVDVKSSLPFDPVGNKIVEGIEYKEKLEVYKSDLYSKKSQALTTIQELDVEDQRLLILRYFDGLSIEEVGYEMEWSYCWAWQRVHRAEENFCMKYKTS